MNDTLDKDVKFKSYQNIFDYFNKKHGKYYLNKNSSPSDYSSCITEHQIEWEGDLIEKLEKTMVIKPFDSEEESYEKYEKYRTEYLDPLLEPYVNQYKKTHMDSYCLWGGCHWWNPTFGLTLARIIMPNEKWIVRSSDYHTTIVNEDETKIFDILYYDKDDKSFGGDNAWENSGMNRYEIRERNIKRNKQTMENKINNCEYHEIYDKTFNQLYTDLDEIDTNINKMETTLEGLTGMILNKEYDNEEKDTRIYKFKNKIIDELFPNIDFEMCIDFNKLNQVITTKKEIKLVQTFNCYCYQELAGKQKANPQPDKEFIIKSNKPMTTRYIINELIKLNFKLDCNHRFLESLEVEGDKLNYFTGS